MNSTNDLVGDKYQVALTTNCLQKPSIKGSAKRSRTSPQSSTSTPTKEIHTHSLSLPQPSSCSTRPTKIQKTCADDKEQKCPSCANSPTKLDIGSLCKEIEDRILQTVLIRLEKLDRDCYDLSSAVRRISQSLSKLNTDFDLSDKLVTVSKDVPAAIPKPSLSSSVERHKPISSTLCKPMETEEQIDKVPSMPQPMDISLSSSVDIITSKKWGVMHKDRFSAIHKTVPSSDISNVLPTESFPNHNPNSAKIPTPDASLDIALKEWAFSTDFRLPLLPQNTLNARISTIQGELIATGYNRVVADGESIWLEVPRANLDLTKFKPRQCTASRHFHTFSGVTAHQQLETERGLSPRRHKLAVKVRRNLPSCRLTAGKWYIHAHQVRVEAEINGRRMSGRLRTNRLVSLLQSIFGRSYHPRSRNFRQPKRSRTPPQRIERPEHDSAPTKPTATWIPTSPLTNNYPLPLLAPPPYQNPVYYTGQLPYNGLVTTTTSAPQLQQPFKQPQMLEQWSSQQVVPNPATFVSDRAPRG